MGARELSIVKNIPPACCWFSWPPAGRSLNAKAKIDGERYVGSAHPIGHLAPIARQCRQFAIGNSVGLPLPQQEFPLQIEPICIRRNM
jgi:hypothetical protein